MQIDVMCPTEETVHRHQVREPVQDTTIRYGDRFMLKSCASRDPRFVSIVRRKAGKRVPSALCVDAVLPGLSAQADCVWTFMPAMRGKKRIGEAVAFGDAVRLQLFDYCGNYRLLATSETDHRAVTALRAPCDRELSTWSVACASSLRGDANGQMVPAGPISRHLEYGKGCYLSLTRAGRYLCFTSGQQGGPSHSVGTLPDWPSTGIAIFWHAYRCGADVDAF